MAGQHALREGWRQVPKQVAPIARQTGHHARLMNNMTAGFNDAEISHTGIKLPSSRGGTGFPWSKLCFGYSLSGAVVTLKPGEVHWGANNATPMAAEAPITLTADYQYVGIEFDPSGPTVSALGPNVSLSAFQSDASTFRVWLYQFRLVAGKASLYRIGHMGNIELPGWFAQ